MSRCRSFTRLPYSALDIVHLRCELDQGLVLVYPWAISLFVGLGALLTKVISKGVNPSREIAAYLVTVVLHCVATYAYRIVLVCVVISVVLASVAFKIGNESVAVPERRFCFPVPLSAKLWQDSECEPRYRGFALS